MRLTFFSTYWTIITALCASLGVSVVGGQIRFWSPPPHTEPIAASECPSRVQGLADELDLAIASALHRADETPGAALPAFRRFAAGWDLRWRRTRYGCDLGGRGPKSLSEAHDRLLGRRYSAETLVRRYAAGEGRERARITAALASAGGAS